MATRTATSKATPEPIFTRETFRFFKDLARHNKKTWMDANRERYQEHVTRPFRRFLEEMSQDVLALDSRFDVMARGGRNFSRINRDIRFAKDKTPYRAQMYLKLGVPFPGGAESGQLYVGLTQGCRHCRVPDLFRLEIQGVGAGASCRSARGGRARLACEAEKDGWRAAAKATGIRPKRATGRQRPGWPTPAEWPKVRGWIVRCKMKPAAAMRAIISARRGEDFSRFVSAAEIYVLERLSGGRDLRRADAVCL